MKRSLQSVYSRRVRQRLSEDRDEKHHSEKNGTVPGHTTPSNQRGGNGPAQTVGPAPSLLSKSPSPLRNGSNCFKGWENVLDNIGTAARNGFSSSSSSQGSSPIRDMFASGRSQNDYWGHREGFGEHMNPNDPNSRRSSFGEHIEINDIRMISTNLTVDDFNLEERIGEGGMGTVFSAQVKNSRKCRAVFGNIRTVAIKSVSKTRFPASIIKAEVENHAVISNHRSVTKLYAFFQDHWDAYVVMEKLPGPSVKRLVRSKMGLGEIGALQVMQQVFDVLSCMHARGCAHLDIKSDNILFENSPRNCGMNPSAVRVIDFGLSIQFPTSTAVYQKTSRRLVGTVGYAAPEVVNAMGSFTSYAAGHADIWSAGCLLYELITGVLPYRGSTLEEVTHDIINGEGILFDGHLSTVDYRTLHLLRDCLSYVPDSRPSAAKALRTVNEILWTLR